MIEPFSDSIVFMDAEFSSLNPYKGEILSIGLVKLNGEELYLELEHDGETDKWVGKNIIPTLKEPKVSREKAKQRIKEFIGNKRPYLAGYVDQFDTIYWHKLFGTENNPCYWLPIDFASLLFFTNTDPASYFENQQNFVKKLGINPKKYRKHHALDDARLLREVYLRFLRMDKK